MFWDKIRLQSMHREILDNENGSHTSVIHLVHYLFVAVSTSIMFIMFIKYVALPLDFPAARQVEWKQFQCRQNGSNLNLYGTLFSLNTDQQKN